MSSDEPTGNVHAGPWQPGAQTPAVVTPQVDMGGAGPQPPSMDARLAKVEGAIDSLRWAVGLLTVVAVGGFAFLGFQVARIDGKLDAIPQRLSDEFHAMRAEMAAQTSAIANAVTAAKQQPPQVILIPAPQPPAPTQQPPNKEQ